MVSCILTEIQNAKKATSDYISSGEGKFSWGYTTQEQHQACIVMMASKDPSENPLAQVTRKPQSFGCVLGINVASVGHASCSSGYYEVVGAFHKLSDEMRESLLRFSISLVPTVKQGERDAIERQCEAK